MAHFLLKTVLLGSLLRLTLGNELPHPELNADECDCSDYYYDHGSPPYHHATCRNITSEEDIVCFENLLILAQNMSTPETAMHISIDTSDMDVFPDDFFKPFNVTSLELNGCNLMDVPYRLINPICDKLKQLLITANEVTSIPADGFLNCSELFSLGFTSNRISVISPSSFSGLPVLTKLDLEGNNLESLEKIDGLENLLEFSVHGNYIGSVATNAFEGMTRLRILELTNNSITILDDGTFYPLEASNPSIYLEGNPFYCNCSMQWLQDWLNQHDNSDDPYCVAPVEGPLKTTDFCSHVF